MNFLDWFGVAGVLYGFRKPITRLLLSIEKVSGLGMSIEFAANNDAVSSALSGILRLTPGSGILRLVPEASRVITSN